MAGLTGSAGPAGDAGPQGRIGAQGAQGPAGVVDRWISYRTFWFNYDTETLRSSDSGQVSEIAYYMQQNPSLKVGIDGSIPQGSNNKSRNTADHRIKAVYQALVNAGVPAYRIETGMFGDSKLAREQRVEVLLRTRN
jgi:outer membrane protein OmpA-like peptidoglycan-associated protein